MVPNQVEFDLTTLYGRGIGRCRATPYSSKDIWDDDKDLRHDTKSGNWMTMEKLVYNNPALKGVSPWYGKPLQLRDANGKLLVSTGDTIRTWYDWPHYKLYIEDQIRYLIKAEIPTGIFFVWPKPIYSVQKHIGLKETWPLLPTMLTGQNPAGCSPYPVSKIDIGTILDERGRELYYEEPRKTELARIAYQMAKSGKSYNGKTYSASNFSGSNFFYDRIMDKNIFYKNRVRNVRGDSYTMSPYHVLWPIPRPAILANSLGQINQNIGYAGSETNKPALDQITE